MFKSLYKRVKKNFLFVDKVHYCYFQIRLAELNGTLETVSLTNVHLVAPITKPNKILGIGLNYKDGADEMVSWLLSYVKNSFIL